MSATTTFLLGTVLLAASSAEDAGALETRLLEAQRLYDETAARSLIDEQWASVGVDTTDEERALFVRGLLLLCELLRIDFEGLSKQDYKEKRALGHQIDSHTRPVPICRRCLGPKASATSLTWALRLRRWRRGTGFC